MNPGFGVLFNIGNSLFGRLNEWRTKRYPQLVITLFVDSGRAVARVAAFSHPIFIQSIRFKFPEKNNAEFVVPVNRMLPPHGEVDCPMPRELASRLILTEDLAVSAIYKTESGREAESDAPIFNLVGGHGEVYKVDPSGKYLGWGTCPTCGELTMFSTEGVKNMKELAKKRREFEKDLKQTHPNHDLSHQKFW
jgi:hypothetical protein